MFGFDFDFTLVEWLLIIIATLLFISIFGIRDYTNQILVINSNSSIFSVNTGSLAKLLMPEAKNK